jgi:hypothetical protein
MIRHRKQVSRRRATPRLEHLEDRTLLSVNVVSNFENGSLAAYKTVLHYYPAADISAAAAHDGLVGLVKHDGVQWMMSTDAAEQVHQGETISVWAKLAGSADGRAYLGFGSTPPTSTQDTSALRTLVLVMAPNTNELLLQSASGNRTFTTFGSSAQTYAVDHWYRLEVAWATGGSITGRLYDDDGTTLLNTVTGTNTTITAGGIAFRGFGGDKYFDTVVVDTDSSGTVAQRANAGGGLDPSYVYHAPPAGPANGPSGGAILPWQYTSVSGTGRDIQLDSWGQLAQAGSIVSGQVVIAGQNTSHNVGTVGVDWGPSFGGAASPLLAQYILRQRPGENTTFIGTASVKHFFAPSILNPGEQDTYGSGLNSDPALFTYGSELDPVTGMLHRQSDLGPIDVNGLNPTGYSTSYPVPAALNVLPHAAVADLDPAMNPPGTRWFHMANVFVEGDQDVSNNSRWIEFVPHFNGTTFTFTYPSGGSGQLNFRTIPGLLEGTGLAGGPYVTGASPAGNTLGPVGHLIVTFNTAIQPDTFTPDQISSFTRTVGSSPTDLLSTVSGVTAVAGSDNKQFDIAFDSQGLAGTYRLTFGPDILDVAGSPMDQDLDGTPGEATDAYTAVFTIQGPSITSSTPSGDVYSAVDHVRLTFNEPITAASLASHITSFTRTVAGVPTDLSSAITGVTPVSGAPNQYDINFASQSGLGAYSLVIGAGVMDAAGNPTAAPYTANFAIQGLKVIASTPSGNNHLPGELISFVTLTFNEAVDPASFTPDKVFAFRGPYGLINVNSVAAVAGTGNTQFRVSFNPQVATGSYTMLVGPDIRDLAGHRMDQNGNGIDGEMPGDTYVATFGIQGLRVTASSVSSVDGYPNTVRLTFNEPVDITTLTSDWVYIAGPAGQVGLLAVLPVPGTAVPYTQFDLVMAPQTTAGAYTVTVYPYVQDVYGNYMDQDGNLTPGEYPSDDFTTTFMVNGPRVLNAAPVRGSAGYDRVRVTFDRPLDPSTVSPDLFGVTAPGGAAVAVNDVAVVPYTNYTQFDVLIDPVTTTGTYRLAIADGLSDVYGNPVAAQTTTFALTVSYTASVATYQSIELLGQPGTQAVTFITSGTQFADDDFGTINLPAGTTFNFYGREFTSLYASSNGLITFGSGNNSYQNTDLRAGSTPTQPAIAPLWTDWVKDDDGSGPMVLWKVQDNKLTIEWNKIRHFGSTPQVVTFQAILDLNTNGRPGNIVFNYVRTDTGDGHADGRDSTVGIEDNVASNARTLVSYNAASPLIGGGKAVLLSAG